MTFAQALARIEEIRLEMDDTDMKSPKYLTLQLELYNLAYQHADSIVQLGKVAEEMRERAGDHWSSSQAYDKLMKGDEG